MDAACALDVDVGERQFNPESFFLVDWLDSPEYFWTTHGGGFRGLFFANSTLSAQERAAVFSFLWINGRWAPFDAVDVKRVELKSETRHPAYVRTRDGGKCSRVFTGVGSDSRRVAKAIIGDDFSVTEEQIAEWLAAHDFVIGQRYDHSRCPIAPSDKGHDSPVVPLDRGVHCHYCGRFAHYVTLIEPEKRRRRRNAVKLCVGGPAHWEHAKLVIEATLGESGKQAELLYRALLKTRWCKPDDSEKRRAGLLKWIDSVFFPRVPMVRGIGQWLLPDLVTPRGDKGLPDLLATLPGATFVNEDGEVDPKNWTVE
jgi:hypothetical protein